MRSDDKGRIKHSYDHFLYHCVIFRVFLSFVFMCKAQYFNNMPFRVTTIWFHIYLHFSSYQFSLFFFFLLKISKENEKRKENRLYISSAGNEITFVVCARKARLIDNIFSSIFSTFYAWRHIKQHARWIIWLQSYKAH